MKLYPCSCIIQKRKSALDSGVVRHFVTVTSNGYLDSFFQMEYATLLCLVALLIGAIIERMEINFIR